MFNSVRCIEAYRKSGKDKPWVFNPFFEWVIMEWVALRAKEAWLDEGKWPGLESEISNNSLEIGT